MKAIAIGLIATVAAALVALCLALVITAHGFALSTLWGWFVVPFFQAPPLPLAMAIGLYCVTRLVLPGKRLPKSEDDGPKPSIEKLGAKLEELGQSIGSSLATSALFLVVGWVAKSFI